MEVASTAVVEQPWLMQSLSVARAEEQKVAEARTLEGHRRTRRDTSTSERMRRAEVQRWVNRRMLRALLLALDRGKPLGHCVAHGRLL